MRLRQIWYAPVLALAMGLMLVRLLIMARLLGVQAFALYSAGLLVSSSFCMLACLGLQLLLQRELPVMIVRRREYAGSVLVMQCTLLAVLCAVVAAAAVVIFDMTLVGLSPLQLVLALVHGLSQQLFLVATVDSRSRGQSMLFARQNLDRAIVILLFSGVAATAGGQAATILSIEAGVSMLLAGLLMRRKFQVVPLRPVVALVLAWRRLPLTAWRSALALLFVTSLAFLTINADRWLAAQWLPVPIFASYAFAWTVLLVAQSVQVIINASVFPMLARRFATVGSIPAFRVSASASLGLLACGAVAALPLWALLDYVVAYWFSTYAEARDLLPVFLVIALLRVSDFWSSYLLVIGKETLLLLLNILSAATAAVVWWSVTQPSANTLRADQVALLALLLAASGYASTAVAAWGCASTFRKGAAT